jgi:hypothetical protein
MKMKKKTATELTQDLTRVIINKIPSTQIMRLIFQLHTLSAEFKEMPYHEVRFTKATFWSVPHRRNAWSTKCKREDIETSYPSLQDLIPTFIQQC